MVLLWMIYANLPHWVNFPTNHYLLFAHQLMCHHQRFNWTYESPKWKDGLFLWSKCQVTFDAAPTDFISRQFTLKLISAYFVTLFCLACNAVTENWHIYVNRDLSYLLTYHVQDMFKTGRINGVSRIQDRSGQKLLNELTKQVCTAHLVA